MGWCTTYHLIVNKKIIGEYFFQNEGRGLTAKVTPGPTADYSSSEVFGFYFRCFAHLQISGLGSEARYLKKHIFSDL